jgi:hemoglobin
LENIRIVAGREAYVPPGGPPRVERPSDAIYAAMGEEAIVAMMEAFYAELAQSPTLRRMFPQTPEALVRAAHRSAAFFIGIMGGPPLYQQMYGNPAMRARHMPFPIDEAARREWLRCFNVVLAIAPARFNFPPEHMPGFQAFLDGFSGWMVNTAPPNPEEAA